MSDAQKTAVLLVNLGTPDAPTPKALRRYLAEFLCDRKVINLPSPLRQLLVYGIILPIRPRRSARLYRNIWLPAGSPLAAYSQSLAEGLSDHLSGSKIDEVILAMRYGQPSIATALASCQQKRIERLIVLPLFPQYCASTVGSVFECVTRQLSQLPWQPSVDFISGYATHHAYIEGLAQSVRDVWCARQQIATKSHTYAVDRRHLILSFHGIPQVQADRGDLYAQQCQQTAMALADALGLASDEWTMAFQSRFGWQTWLQPYLDQVLQEKIDQGIEHLDIICPGFSVDCLETLEEIRDDYSRQFVDMGGKDCFYIPALNARPDHIKALAAVIESH